MTVTAPVHVSLNIPDNAFGGDVPLVAVERGGFVGSLHRGTIAVADPVGSLSIAVGDVAQPVFLRSAAKPFQVMPAVLSGGIERFGITEPEFAVLCASHAAERRHIEAVLSVLEKIGLGEGALRCGTHPPIDERTAQERIRSGIPPSPVCNNCSGAHAGMLLACQSMGWPVEGYEHSSHPLQRRTLEILSSFTDLPVASIEYGVDNCCVPTFHLPIWRAAMAFSRLATGQNLPEDLASAAQRVRTTMTAHPGMIGGNDSFDTDLMQVAAGELVAKGGAEGFQGIACRALGLGVAIKISDGNERAIPPVAMVVLTFLNAITERQRQQLDAYARPSTLNMQGAEVGHLAPVFALGTAL